MWSAPIPYDSQCNICVHLCVCIRRGICVSKGQFPATRFWYPYFNYARAHDADDIQESAIRANFEAFAQWPAARINHAQKASAHHCDLHVQPSEWLMQDLMPPLTGLEVLGIEEPQHVYVCTPASAFGAKSLWFQVYDCICVCSCICIRICICV